MPKEKKIERDIHKLYRANAIDLMMFGYVNGVRAALHTVSVHKALEMFMSEFALDEDDYSIETAHVLYNRMNNQLKETKK